MHWPLAYNVHGKGFKQDNFVFLNFSWLRIFISEDRRQFFPMKADGTFDLNLDLHFTQTWEDLQNLPTSKAKAVGVSNFSVHNLEILLKHCSEKNLKIPAVNQIELHPSLPQDDMLEYCKQKGILLTAYSPLGSTGGPFMEKPEIKAVAEKKNVSPANILLSWHVARGCSAVLKSVTPERIEANLNIVPLDESELNTISSPETIAKYGVKRIWPINYFGVDMHFPDSKPQ